MEFPRDTFIAFVLSLTIVLTLLLGYNIISAPPEDEVPDYVYWNQQIERAYSFVGSYPEESSYLPCYCGCDYMVHSDEVLQHGSLKECFFKPDGSYEPHGANCGLCYVTANMAEDMLENGDTLVQIREAIDAEYGGKGRNGTKTPMPAP